MGGRHFLPASIARMQSKKISNFFKKDVKVTNHVRKIADPLISPGGKIYSAGGIKRLWREIFPESVDNRAHCWKKSMRRSDHHDSKQQPSNLKGK